MIQNLKPSIEDAFSRALGRACDCAQRERAEQMSALTAHGLAMAAADPTLTLDDFQIVVSHGGPPRLKVRGKTVGPDT